MFPVYEVATAHFPSLKRDELKAILEKRELEMSAYFRRRPGESMDAYSLRMDGILRFPAVGDYLRAVIIPKGAVQGQAGAGFCSGMAAYKKEHGQAPETLQALVPAYLEKLPEDPITGRPFSYGWKGGPIYSWGINGVDDHGISDNKEMDDIEMHLR